MIKVEGLTKRYGPTIAVNNISFEVDRGEIVGFLGPNGAGKTTTMRILTGFLPPTLGKATVAGFDVIEQPLEVKKRIGYLPETPPLYPEMEVDEYLDFVARLKGIARPRDRRPHRFRAGALLAGAGAAQDHRPSLARLPAARRAWPRR